MRAGMEPPLVILARLAGAAATAPANGNDDGTTPIALGPPQLSSFAEFTSSLARALGAATANRRLRFTVTLLTGPNVASLTEAQLEDESDLGILRCVAGRGSPARLNSAPVGARMPPPPPPLDNPEPRPAQAAAARNSPALRAALSPTPIIPSFHNSYLIAAWATW